jgi:transposase
MRVRPTYTDEFKSDALEALHRSDRSLREVADSLGISASALSSWYRKEAMAKKTKGHGKARPAAPVVETAEQRVARLERENEKLRKEIETLRMDREILKKAAAFFAKESE